MDISPRTVFQFILLAIEIFWTKEGDSIVKNDMFLDSKVLKTFDHLGPFHYLTGSSTFHRTFNERNDFVMDQNRTQIVLKDSIKTWLKDGGQHFDKDAFFKKDESNKSKEPRNRRHQAFGNSDRAYNRQLRRNEKRKSPFSSIIRLSVGCTGTLLTTRHVLTAAHCIHNGTHLTINPRNFRIEIPSNNGRTVDYTAVEIRLPRKWANIDTYSRFRAMYDFSIITLSHRTPSHLGQPRVAISQKEPRDPRSEVIQFAGFPTGSPNSMWRTVCSFRGARYIHEGNVFHLKRCSAPPGYSGAGIFKISQRNKTQLIGVVSHLLQRKNNGQNVNYIVVSAFTRKKKLLLCNMMGNGSNLNELCGTKEIKQRSSAMPYVVFDISHHG